MRQLLSRKERGLSKYDAPLYIQYKKGVNAFRMNTLSPYHSNTMQHREWQRGWNDAYDQNLKKVLKWKHSYKKR
jgi:ribosome modulation factor